MADDEDFSWGKRTSLEAVDFRANSYVTRCTNMQMPMISTLTRASRRRIKKVIAGRAKMKASSYQ